MDMVGHWYGLWSNSFNTAAASKFDAAGNLTDSATRDHIAKMLVALAEWTERLRQN